MKAAETSRILAMLIGAYPTVSVGPETVAIYERLLADLDHASVQRAVVEHIATNRWFPTIAELRERVAEQAIGAPTASEAIALLQQAAVTGHGTRDFHPLIREAFAAVGGMWELTHTTAPGRWRQDFREQYETRRKSEIRAANIGNVVEQLASTNRARVLLPEGNTKCHEGKNRPSK